MEKKSYKAEEEGHYGVVMPEMTVMQPEVVNVDGPSQSVAWKEILCKHGNPVKYRDCVDYNTDFCRRECAFGAKEIVISDVNLDYQNPDGK